MLAFLNVAFLIYGAMHIYALGRVWLAFPHQVGLGLTLMLWGLVMIISQPPYSDGELKMPLMQ